MNDNQWVFKVVFKANGKSSSEAQEKVFNALASIDSQVEQDNLNEQPYILSYQSEDGLISG
jgi:hypothetical protein